MFSRKPTRQILWLSITAALLLASCNVGAAPSPTLDVNALNTAIVGTTVAQLSVQFTQTALAVPTNTVAPTSTPTTLPSLGLPTLGGASPTTDVSALPTFSFLNTPVTNNTPAPGTTQVAVLPTSAAQATASLGDACNNNVFEGDANYPDGSVLKPGEDFVKRWTVRNTGNCTWDEGYRLVFIGGDTAIDPVNFEFKKSEDFVSPGESINLGIPLTAPLKEGTYQGTWRMQTDSGYYFGTLLTVYFEVKK